MLAVGAQALEAVDHQLAQAAHILIPGGQHADLPLLVGPQRLILAVPAGGLGQGNALRQLAAQAAQRGQHPVGLGADGSQVKVGVGDGHKQAAGYQMVDFLVHSDPRLARLHGGGAQPLGQPDQKILPAGHIGHLAAYARLVTAAVSRRLLALVAKHFAHHTSSAFILMPIIDAFGA